MSKKITMYRASSSSLKRSLAVIGTLILLTVPFSIHAENGKQIVEKKCVACHVRPDPHNLTAEMWIERVDAMAPQAQLNAHEKEAVLKYLQDNSSTLEELLASEKPHYVDKCSKCHSLEDVPSIVMKGSELEDFLFEHVEDKGGSMENEQAHEIAEFLLHTKIMKK